MLRQAPLRVAFFVSTKDSVHVCLHGSLLMHDFTHLCRELLGHTRILPIRLLHGSLTLALACGTAAVGSFHSHFAFALAWWVVLLLPPRLELTLPCTCSGSCLVQQSVGPFHSRLSLALACGAATLAMPREVALGMTFLSHPAEGVHT